MTIMQIEQRLRALEKDMATLKAGAKVDNPWWNEIAGVFANDPLFEEAVRLGREQSDPLERKVVRKMHRNTRRKTGK